MAALLVFGGTAEVRKGGWRPAAFFLRAH
jgi:hypothetical protein